MTVEFPDTDHKRGESIILDMTTFEEETLAKVYAGLKAAGIYNQDAIDAVNQIQGQGILFRENVKKEDFYTTVTEERASHSKLGYDATHDAEHGLEHLVHLAQIYFARGQLAKGNAMLLAIEDFARNNPRPKINPMQEDDRENIPNAVCNANKVALDDRGDELVRLALHYQCARAIDRIFRVLSSNKLLDHEVDAQLSVLYVSQLRI